MTGNFATGGGAQEVAEVLESAATPPISTEVEEAPIGGGDEVISEGGLVQEVAEFLKSGNSTGEVVTSGEVVTIHEGVNSGKGGAALAVAAEAPESVTTRPTNGKAEDPIPDSEEQIELAQCPRSALVLELQELRREIVLCWK